MLTLYTRAHSVCCVHATASSCTRARILLDIFHNLIRRELPLGCALEVLVYVCTVALVARRDVDGLLERLRVAGHYRATVNHERRAIVSCECHDDSRHVLVTAGNSYTSIVVLSACYGLDAVGYYLAGLKREAHSYMRSVLNPLLVG